MNRNEIIKSCLTGDWEERVTGLDILNHVKSPFTTFCNSFVDEQEKDPANLFFELLAEKGTEHEKHVLDQQHPTVKVLEFEDQISGFKMALNEMFKGVDSISNVPLLYLPQNFVGRADLLIKSEYASSIFGDFHYEIYEIKIAKHIKKHHILQAVYYNKILSYIQDYSPEFVYLINKEMKVSQFDYSEYIEELNQILDQIGSIRNGQLKPIPDYNGVEYPWTNYSNKMARENLDLTCIVNLGPSLREELIQNGIDSIQKIGEIEVKELKQVPGIGPTRALQFKNYAEVLLRNKPKKIRKPKLKRQNIELFIDFEGVDPTLAPEELGSFDFLFGVMIKINEDDLRYHPFFIKDPWDENHVEEVFLDFINFLKEYNGYPIYHWHHYEKTRTKMYFKKLEIVSEKRSILKNYIDLYKILKKSWVLPVMSLSIKDVAKYLGFSWRHDHFDGRAAIGKYLGYQKYKFRRDELKKEILDYNEDDIMALVHVFDWLIEDKQSLQ